MSADNALQTARLDWREAPVGSSLVPDTLIARVRGEFREMPGLRLTFAQACRLWQMDNATCEAILYALITENFLCRTADGAYIALPSPGGQLKSVGPARCRSRRMA